MNKVVLMGRLVKDPESRGKYDSAVTKYTLAVSRKTKEESDFIPCVAFEKRSEFAERYLKKGTKIVVSGRIQTGSYVNKDGVKVYTTEVVVEDQEFAESKQENKAQTLQDMFSPIDEPLPFK